MQCEMGSGAHQKTTEATQSVMSGDAERPLLWICGEHAKRLQHLPRERKPQEGDCVRCQAKPGEHLYPLGGERASVCDSCWRDRHTADHEKLDRWNASATSMTKAPLPTPQPTKR